ncbi:hypothetical protein ACFFGH_06520 [Lysobacter korlensis]|uniref:Transposase n=1 Tax=Lysobacter korlensis TaxID=553636 RepID=A0ABV6RNN8_9GAMM
MSAYTVQIAPYGTQCAAYIAAVMVRAYAQEPSVESLRTRFGMSRASAYRWAAAWRQAHRGGSVPMASPAAVKWLELAFEFRTAPPPLEIFRERFGYCRGQAFRVRRTWELALRTAAPDRKVRHWEVAA